MPGSLSTYLDLLRFGAALAVFIGHLVTNAKWSGIEGHTLSIQNDAVVCFFVLSGMVIGFVSEQKEHDFGVYLRARLARLWSVAIPALLITILLDALGHRTNPSAYFAPAIGGIETLRQLLVSTLFLNQIRHWSVIPGSNLPYWSLSYEFAYYLLFGIAFYMRGWIRAGLLILCCAVIGPRILLLLPVWLLGWIAWRQRDRLSPKTGTILFVGSILLYLILSVSDAGPAFGRMLDATLLRNFWLDWSRLAGWKYLLGLLVTVNILGFSAFARHVSFGRAAIVIRTAAAMTLRALSAALSPVEFLRGCFAWPGSRFAAVPGNREPGADIHCWPGPNHRRPKAALAQAPGPGLARLGFGSQAASHRFAPITFSAPFDPSARLLA